MGNFYIMLSEIGEEDKFKGVTRRQNAKFKICHIFFYLEMQFR